MRAYFSQFGEINLLRLSRNRTTGRSKHFGYIQFASDSVAKVVADTMDNYLMFGHILKCKFVPEDQLHPETFKGANRRFKMVPWNRIEKKTLEAGNTRTQWSKKIEKEEAKRVAKAEKMKALGYEIDLPALTSVDEVPVQKTLNEKPPSENSIIEPFKAIEAVEPPGKDELKKPKKPKRGKDVVNADSTKETLPDPVKELVPEKSTKVQQSDGKETAEKNDKDLKKEKKKKTKKASGPTADDIGKQSNAVETKTKPVKQKETKVKAKKGEQVEPSKKKQKKTEA